MTDSLALVWAVAGGQGRTAFDHPSDDRAFGDTERRLFVVADARGPRYGGYYAPLGIDVGIETIAATLGAPSQGTSAQCAAELGAALVEAGSRMGDLDRAHRAAFEATLKAAKGGNRLAASLAASREIAKRLGRSLDTFAHFYGSVTALRFADSSVAVAQVGTCRAYRLRGDALSLLLPDHAHVEGPRQITIASRMLGAEPTIEPDLSVFEAAPGDLYMVCSDGVWNFIGERTLEQILRSSLDVATIVIVRALGRGRSVKPLIVWDFAGTLAYREGGEWGATLLESLRRRTGDHALTPNDTRPHLQHGFPWASPSLTHPHRTADDWWNALFPVLASCVSRVAPVSLDVAWSIARDAREHYADPAAWRLYPETRGVLQSVRQEGFRSIILSNFTPELHDLVDAFGIRDFFDDIVCSAQTGFEKPHPEAFRIAVQRAGSASTAWMVGDSFSCDVEGAARAGLRPIWIRRSGAVTVPDGRQGEDQASATCMDLSGVLQVVGALGGDG